MFCASVSLAGWQVAPYTLSPLSFIPCLSSPHPKLALRCHLCEMVTFLLCPCPRTGLLLFCFACRLLSTHMSFLSLPVFDGLSPSAFPGLLVSLGGFVSPPVCDSVLGSTWDLSQGPSSWLLLALLPSPTSLEGCGVQAEGCWQGGEPESPGVPFPLLPPISSLCSQGCAQERSPGRGLGEGGEACQEWDGREVVG